MFKNEASERYDARKKKVLNSVLVLIGVGFLLLLAGYQLYLASPGEEKAKMVRIRSGMNLEEITELLAEEGVVRSARVTEVLARLRGVGTQIEAGDYFFSEPISAWEVTSRLLESEKGIDLVRVTLPEGLTANQKAHLISSRLPEVDRSLLAQKGQKYEGYLFPDTYYFSPFSDEAEILEIMLDNFKNRIEPLEEEIERSERTLEEIVIMASMLELEARTTESRRMISGLLWKRLDDGMLLQVDAVFPYIIGKNTFEVTLEDLRYDSPYNTYRYPGLPAGAIANPGLDSIKAALRPIESPYWYYLSDMEGNMHYTITHEDHVRNKHKYLR